MRTTTWLTILTSLLIGSAAPAANWFIDRNFIKPAQASNADDFSSTAYVQLQKGMRVFLRPTTTGANQRIFFGVPAYCSWDDAAMNVDIGANEVFSGVEFWQLIHDKACSSAGASVGECAVWKAPSGMFFEFAQKAAGTTGTLTCGATQ